MKNYKCWIYASLVILFLSGSFYAYFKFHDYNDYIYTATSLVAGSGNSADFEKAWKEGASSQTYSTTCKVSAGSVKVQNSSEITADQKKLLDIVGRAITSYKEESTGMLLGSKKQLYASLTKVDSLGALDALTVAGQLTPDAAEAALKSVSKKTAEIALNGKKVYLKTDGSWKTFESADFANSFYTGATSDTLASGFEKNSFTLKTPATKSTAAIYEGKLTPSSTVSLLTPFMGEDAAALQAGAPVKLSIQNGHFKKFDVTDKITLGTLSFTVKEACTLAFGTPKITIPSSATTISADEGLEIIVNAF